jgi:hypothetical protein
MSQEKGKLISGSVISFLAKEKAAQQRAKAEQKLAEREEKERRTGNKTLCTEGSSSFVTSTTASVVTGWNEPAPG